MESLRDAALGAGLSGRGYLERIYWDYKPSDQQRNEAEMIAARIREAEAGL
jgi:hypothetical protein